MKRFIGLLGILCVLMLAGSCKQEPSSPSIVASWEYNDMGQVMILNAYDNNTWDVVMIVTMDDETQSLLVQKGSYEGDFNTNGIVKITLTEETDEDGNLKVLENPITKGVIVSNETIILGEMTFTKK